MQKVAYWKPPDRQQVTSRPRHAVKNTTHGFDDNDISPVFRQDKLHLGNENKSMFTHFYFALRPVCIIFAGLTLQPKA